MPLRAAVLCVAALALPAAAFAQQAPALDPAPGPPGPYVIDVRGTTAGLPQANLFYPFLPSGGIVPARGFGFDVGAHVYPVSLGPSRLGVGLSVLRVRGAAVNASAEFTALAPQISFNFGSERGWSYVSAGVGAAQVSSSLEQLPAPAPGSATSGGGAGGTTPAAPAVTEFDGDRETSVNVGGGARWFLSDRVGVGFDIRMHRMPSFSTVSASVGLSMK